MHLFINFLMLFVYIVCVFGLMALISAGICITLEMLIDWWYDRREKQ